MIELMMDYCYNGSSNSSLRLVESYDGDVDLVTDYGETVASVQTGYGLLRVLEELAQNKYA